jgi:1-deoxy-D-xylulose-5-phosphate reductoisomerase
MAAIVGSAGLQSTLAAVTAGKKVLLANKESLVMAGPLFMAAVKSSNAVLLPIDSEHNAIFQCLPQPSLSDSTEKIAFSEIKKILLTGSGGPFRSLPLGEFSQVTPEQACSHPNWSMGRKISVDSATMMNKGLELIEACYLFDCQPSLIEILVHPQSIIHSMVEYVDGSVLAQLGQPDMRTPIAHALAWPQRIRSGVQSLDWQQLSALSFESPDLQRFPSLAIARQVANDVTSASIIFNAANEVAVQSFLDNKLSFTRIISVVEESLSKIPSSEPSSLFDIKAVDEEARHIAGSLITCL